MLLPTQYYVNRSMPFLREDLKFSNFYIDVLGWGRVVYCVFLVQPIIIMLLITFLRGGLEEGSSLYALAMGLCANAEGHVSYLMYRTKVLYETLQKRNKLGTTNMNKGSSIRQYQCIFYSNHPLVIRFGQLQH